MTNYNDGKWHGWNGGERPVHPKSVVEAAYPAGEKYGNSEEAGDLRWDHIYGGNKGGDIIAFRVVKEHREPREWWMIGKSPMDTLEKAKEFLEELGREHPGLDFGPIIHVREVL